MEPAALKKARELANHVFGVPPSTVQVILTTEEAFELLEHFYVLKHEMGCPEIDCESMRVEIDDARGKGDPFPLLSDCTLYGMHVRPPVALH